MNNSNIVDEHRCYSTLDLTVPETLLMNIETMEPIQDPLLDVPQLTVEEMHKLLALEVNSINTPAQKLKASVGQDNLDSLDVKDIVVKYERCHVKNCTNNNCDHAPNRNGGSETTSEETLVKMEVELKTTDVLNTSFSGSELENFDIGEFVFGKEDKTLRSPPAEQVIDIKKEKNECASSNMIKPVLKKQVVPIGRKKLELMAHYQSFSSGDSSDEDEDCYSDVDIETVSNEGSPILVAGSVDDLLDQFEEVTNNDQKYSPENDSVQTELDLAVAITKQEIKEEPELVKPQISLKDDVRNEILTKTVPKNLVDKDLIEEKSKGTLLPDVESQSNNRQNSKCNGVSKSSDKDLRKIHDKNENKDLIKEDSKNILSAKENSKCNRSSNTEVVKERPKRKITLIEPIPINKKRFKLTKHQNARSNDALLAITKTKNENNFDKVPIDHLLSSKVLNDSINEPSKRQIINDLNKTSKSNATVCKEPRVEHIDHDYCNRRPESPENRVQKDSEFASAEDDEKTIINGQPIVKNVDGTLMVSLLKSNTVKVENKSEKKKLNLEDYKKRRNDVFNNSEGSNNSSRKSSCNSSPRSEDDVRNPVTYRKKMNKMFKEVLNAIPKSEQNSKVFGQPSSYVVVKSPPVPDNLERIEVISVAVNTDLTIKPKEDLYAPVKTLQEMEPILKKASDKITENSLITSVIKNIPKVISKSEEAKKKELSKVVADYIQCETKIVKFLKKDRVRCETRDAMVQTDVMRGGQNEEVSSRELTVHNSSASSYRHNQRPMQTSTTNDVRHHVNGYHNTSMDPSNDVGYKISSHQNGRHYSSRISTSSSSSPSRSLSPDYDFRRDRPNPKKFRSINEERDFKDAVYERRIIYVGDLLPDTTRTDLYRKFKEFGEIAKISLHENTMKRYGFVTFRRKEDAFTALEHGNDNPNYPTFRLNFGGRREFCHTEYVDLDNMPDDRLDPLYLRQSRPGFSSYDGMLQTFAERRLYNRID